MKTDGSRLPAANLTGPDASVISELPNYQGFFEQSPIASFILSPAAAVLRANPAGLALLGPGCLTQPFSAQLDPVSQPPFASFIQDIFANARPAALQVSLANRPTRLVPALDGATHTCLLSAVELPAAAEPEDHRFRRFADQARDLVYRYRLLPTLGFDYVSPSSLEINGYTPEEFYADPELAMRIVHDEDKHIALDAMRSPAGPSQELTLRWVRKDGRVIWIEQHATLFLTHDGRLEAVECIARDISARKRVEHILAARLRLIEYSAGHSLHQLLRATLDELEVITGSLIGFFHFLQADQQTLVLQTWSSRTLREMCTASGSGSHYSVDQAGVWADCVRSGHAVIHNDYPHMPGRRGMPEGHAVVQREMVVPVKRGGQIVAILGVGNKPQDYTETDLQTVTNLADLAWDIAERKQTGLALEQSRNFLAETEKIGSVGGWELDIDSGRQVWTEEVYRIHEVDSSFQPTVENGIGFYTSASRPVIEAAVQRAINSGEPFDVELEIITARGSQRWVHAIGKADLQRRKLRGFFQDITPRKQVEAQILALNASLEQRVAERTAELRSANLELDRALRAKDEFMAAVSHELRTPLTGVIGLSQVLQLPSYGALSPKQLSAVHNIEKSGLRQLELINAILDYAMTQSGKVELRLQPCTLDDICRNSLHTVSEDAAQKRQTLVYNMIPEDIILLADQQRLRQVIANLLSNAVKFTPIGGKIELEARGAAETGQVHISISDNGIGIRPEDMPRLFQPFLQLDMRLARAYEGIGLGLALVKALTVLHGGQVDVESSFGKGSRFTVSLPWRV